MELPSLSTWRDEMALTGTYEDDSLQEYLAHKKTPPPTGPSQGPRHRTIIGPGGFL